MTPPAPIDARKRVLVIKRRALGNCLHHSIGLSFGLATLKRKKNLDRIV